MHRYVRETTARMFTHVHSDTRNVVERVEIASLLPVKDPRQQCIVKRVKSAVSSGRTDVCSGRRYCEVAPACCSTAISTSHQHRIDSAPNASQGGRTHHVKHPTTG